MASKLAQLRAKGLVMWLHAALGPPSAGDKQKGLSRMNEGKRVIHDDENNPEPSQFVSYYSKTLFPQRQTDAI